MYNGKRVNKRTAARAKRKTALLVSLILLFTMTMGATVAFLIDQTQEEKNVFTPAEVPPTIVEKFENNVKENVRVTNLGDVDAYIRAAIVVTWQDTQGNVAPVVPGEDDYTLEISTTDGWSAKQADGYYYYLSPVAANDPKSDADTTGVLISKATQNVEMDGYTLSIEILAQTIQVEGTDAKGNRPIELAWNVDIVDGQLKAATITE